MGLKQSAVVSTAARYQRHMLGAFCAGALVLVLVVSLMSFAFAGASGFTDVPDTHPYHDAIVDLAAREIINGYANGTFVPGEDVKRQQFAKMTVLTGGYPVSEADVCRFKDVQKSDGSALYPDNYVAVCAAQGITTGKTATTFDPYSSITRYQVITMVVRMADDLDPFLLATPPAGWQATHGWGSDPTHGANAARAEYNGLLEGLPLSSLSPRGVMNRGEVAQVLHNLLTLLPPITTSTTATTTSTTSSSTTTTATSTTTTTEGATTTTSSSTTSSSSTTTSSETTSTTAPATGSGYDVLDVAITGPPSLDAYMVGGLDVFARSAEGQLISSWYDGEWNDWEYLGMTMPAGSGPASVAWETGALDVFVRGLDNGLYHRQYTDAWLDWESLGGNLASDPAVASQSVGQLDVFWRGPLDHLYHQACHALVWTAAEDLGGALQSEPAAVSWGPNRIDVFALAAGNTLWHTWWNGISWQQENLGGALTSGPAACSRGSGLIDVFARGAGDTIWQISYNGTWSAWQDLGGPPVASAPDAAAWASDRIDLVVQGTDGNLWHRWWNGASWQP